jgi:hypothetical protein
VTAVDARSAPVVAVCQGHRCRALLARQDPDGMCSLRAAARDSDRGVLLSTGCAGSCTHAPVVALGTGREADGTLAVLTRAVLGPVAPVHVAALGRYLQSAAPAGVPADLGGVMLLSRAERDGT